MQTLLKDLIVAGMLSAAATAAEPPNIGQKPSYFPYITYPLDYLDNVEFKPEKKT